MNIKLAKIFRQLMQFGKLETDNGVLIYEGDVLTEGTEVFIEDENGEIVPAPDGEYSEYTVKDGKIVSKKEEETKTDETSAEEKVNQETQETTETNDTTETTETTETNPEEEDKYETRIKALEEQVAELKKLLEDLIKKEEETFSSMKPAEKVIKDTQSGNGKGALKYFK